MYKGIVNKNKKGIKKPILKLNSSILDSNLPKIEQICYRLNKLANLAVESIISNYKEFSYLEGKILEISLVFCNDLYITELNQKWQGILKPTNVLSMSLFESYDAQLNHLILLGDIVISLETANKEAYIYGYILEDYLAVLLVHGILHIFSFDHQNNKEAIQMLELEESIIEKFNNKLKALTNNYWN